MRQLQTRRPQARGHWQRATLHLSLAAMIILLLALVAMPAMASSPETDFTLTVLHTNDTHAHIQSFTESNVVQGGVARRYTAIQQVHAEGGNVLLVDAGDSFQGTLFFNYWQGLEEAHFMNLLGYQAAAIGNHEFDSGPPALARYIEAADFPVLGANIDASAQVSLTGMIEPYAVIDVNGQSIGVFGLTTEDTPSISSPGPDVIFNDAVASAQTTVATLQGMGINKIVALSHLGYIPDQALAAAVPGIDVIVGGHSHTPLGSMPGAQGPYPTVGNSPSGDPVLIVSAWEWGRYLGRLDVTFNDAGVIQSYNGNPIFLNSSIAEDPTLLAEVAVWGQPVQQLQNTVIAETQVTLDGVRANVRTKETNMGDLICDAMLWKTRAIGTQICITNGGGIRAPIDVGNVTIGNILTVLPFGNQIATLGLTGNHLLAALENGVSRWEVADGRFPQVAGMRYVFDPEQPAGQRILSAQLMNSDGSYSNIDPNQVYQIVTNDFMRRGGDFYTVFAQYAIDPYDTWAVMADSVVEYIQAPEAEGGLNSLITAEDYPLAGQGRIIKRSATVNRSQRFNVDRDTFISGAQPGAHYGDSMTMWTGFFGQLRPLVHTPMMLPNNALIDQAYLYLYVVEGRGFTTWANSVINVEAHKVTTEWMPVAANWTMPWTMAGGDYGPALSSNHIGSGKIGTWVRFDVTGAARDFLHGMSNQGFIVTNDDTTGVRYAFATKEYFDASKVGYMRVYYRTYE